MIISVLVPLLAVSVFCSANIIFNLREGGSRSLALIMIHIIAVCVAVGMFVCFAGAYITERKMRRHAKYTYLDILPKGIIYSRYAGEHSIYGSHTVYRRLYYIPFKQLTEISRDKKQSPKSITINGEIHSYFLTSDELGYHIDEEGELSFNHPELNERFFETLSVLKIDSDFGSTTRLLHSIEHYREKFRNTPEKKPFNIADYVTVKHKKPMRTSNPALDAPSFDRKW